MTTKKTILLGFAVCTVIGTGIALLLQNINHRQFEAEQTHFKVVELNETISDPAVWGANFPRQYDTYRRTVDMVRTKFGGSEADPSEPGQTTSKIEADPRYKTMWNGYAFAVDFREERGHAYMLQDQKDTKRQQVVKQPGACLHCHASTTVPYRQAGIDAGAPGELKEPLLSAHGQEQLHKGFVELCAKPYSEAVTKVAHPVSCIDCHDPSNSMLRITKPGLLNGLKVLAESPEPLPHLPSLERWRKGDKAKPYDPNIEASRQEMRTLVCAQCHVEYYFKGDGKLLTYPWQKGLKADSILDYYDQPQFKDNNPFKDWTHKDTGAPMLKAQHPEFELWSQGTHARAGVSCADCHMPYVRDGAVKVSSHHVRSPMLDVARACQTCHRTDEESLRQRVATIQNRTDQLMSRSLNGLSDLIGDLKKARADGLTDAQLDTVRQYQRQASWRIDFVGAENSTGFHAPQESARLLGEACDLARMGQVQLLRVRNGEPAVAPAASNPPAPSAPAAHVAPSAAAK
jgi:nitrite reductase (cytochrome c-552)